MESSHDHRDTHYDVTEPEAIDVGAAISLLDERHQRTWRLFGIESFLSVKRTGFL
jgi:hypothetical protein